LVTREARLADFESVAAPPPDAILEMLCEDHNGTYLLPFPCRLTDGELRNANSGERIEVQTIGWRAWTK
jgi:hypothetical protein